MAAKYQFWGGPADGIDIVLDPDMQYLEYIYIRLPVKGERIIYNEPPSTPYARYQVGEPTPSKCKWAGSWE